MKQAKRLADEFLTNRGITLGNKGFQSDNGLIETLSNGNIVFYHFTHENRLEHILGDGDGLYAYREVACPKLPIEFKGNSLIEGFLQPLPEWLTGNFYFGDFGIQLVQHYIGNILLRIEVPLDFPGIYVADYAHLLECKYLHQHGSSSLGLGYECQTGNEATQAYVNSYIPIKDYKGGHIAPVVQILRRGKGLTIPSRYLSISTVQPLS